MCGAGGNIMVKRVTLIVLDSLGIGQLPDAENYGDKGADTLGHIVSGYPQFSIPNLQKLGFGNIQDAAGGAYAVSEPAGSFGKLKELSKGKDTITGHWEIAGLRTDVPFKTYPDGFPAEFISQFEEAIGREGFVPNDTELNENGRIMIITGPNMAGKSTYMRQVALVVLMAHMGCFVPASFADVSLTDRIFTRIGASDDLYSGQSTFMVEMSEMAVILKNATEKSLVILDEVGRGTSTFDGLSIAWAAVEHIANEKCGARTLFATHYHELSVLEGQLSGVVNYRVTAKEQGEDVIFLRKVVPGGEDRSYGVAVAKLAGLPKDVIARARQIMARLEVDDEQKGSIGKTILDKRKNAGNRQISMMDFKPMELIEEIRAIDVMGMSPIDALNELYKLCEKARRI